MNINILHILIKHFDHFVKGIDFKHLPEQESEEYRTLILKTANNQIFIDGRYSQITEWTIEFFDDEELQAGLRDLTMINSLTKLQRTKLRFYLDLGQKTCYPLFRAQHIDWSQWPWNMSCGEESLNNRELVDFIIKGEYPCLSAAIIYYFSQHAWLNEEYSSVARQEAVNAYEYHVNHKWSKEKLKTEEDMRLFMDSIEKATDDIWDVENHILVGKQLGFDHITQGIYDAVDTFVDSTYRNSQIELAREMRTWIDENWTLGVRHPEAEKIKELYDKLVSLMAKYSVTSPDMSFTWDLIMIDELHVSLYRAEEKIYSDRHVSSSPHDDDDDDWDGDDDWDADEDDNADTYDNANVDSDDNTDSDEDANVDEDTHAENDTGGK